MMKIRFRRLTLCSLERSLAQRQKKQKNSDLKYLIVGKKLFLHLDLSLVNLSNQRKLFNSEDFFRLFYEFEKCLRQGLENFWTFNLSKNSLGV